MLDTGHTVDAYDLASVKQSLEKGFTLPAEWYSDRKIFELERDLVFSRTWQLVALSLDVKEPGSFTTVQLDETREFIIVRDLEGRLRAFHNVCAHRANPIATGSGKGRALQCGYHGWTYGLDGTLKTARGMDGSPNFDTADFGLSEVSVDEWEPFLFLNPDPDAGPLMDFLGTLPAKVAELGLDLAAIASESAYQVFDTEFDCNWKIATENSLECYHCSVAHPGLAATVDLPQWHISMDGSCIIQGTALKEPDAFGAKSARSTQLGQAAYAAARAPGGIDVALFHYVFPNNSISVWPGPGNSFNIGRFVPIGPEKTRRWSVRWWSQDVPEDVRKEQWDFYLQVTQEDRAIVEGVHRGMRSGGWRQGQFQLQEPLTGEHGVWQFNKMLLAKIMEGEG